METEQPIYSNPPRKHPQVGNLSTGSKHPKELGYGVASPGSSKSALVLSITLIDLQVHCHQDLEYILDWKHTF